MADLLTLTHEACFAYSKHVEAAEELTKLELCTS